MGPVAERQVATNGIELRVTEEGEGPLLVLCHGFPELAFSKPPLSSDLEGGDFFALRPETNGSRRYAQPFRNSRRCEKWFMIG